MSVFRDSQTVRGIVPATAVYAYIDI